MHTYKKARAEQIEQHKKGGNRATHLRVLRRYKKGINRDAVPWRLGTRRYFAVFLPVAAFSCVGRRGTHPKRKNALKTPVFEFWRSGLVLGSRGGCPFHLHIMHTYKKGISRDAAPCPCVGKGTSVDKFCLKCTLSVFGRALSLTNR